MDESQRTTPAPASTSATPMVDRSQAVALVESDRYCEHCGYNLHTQPVVRDERLALLLIRCPECGRWHPALATHSAVRPWLQRIGALALFGWMLAIVGLACLVMVLMGVVSYGTIESMTGWEAVYVSPAPIATDDADADPDPTATQPITTWKRVVRTDFREYWLFMSVMTSLTAALALIWSLLSAVAMHHWRRAALAVGATAVPILPAVWVRQLCWWEAPELLPWSQSYIVWHALVAVVVGVIGVCIARPLMRFAAVLLLPPRARAPLAFLWLTDGKAPPAK